MASCSTSLAHTPRPSSWQEELRDAFAKPQELSEAGFALPPDLPRDDAFCFRVPRSYAALFDRDNLSDCPLFRQALPSARECDPALPPWAQRLSRLGCGHDAPWRQDPIGDVTHLAAPRLTHRYVHRAILHTTWACALYCRFCFRKHAMAQGEPALYEGTFAPALAYVQAHDEISELILTGGDPLSLSNQALRRLLEKVACIEHVRVVRLHSRMLGVLPARIDDELLETLGRLLRHKQVVVVAHIAHPRELTPDAQRALRALRQLGVVTMHQMVLLRGVNDDVDTLHTLFGQLYALGCVPHYVHHPDWTPDTFGFRVSIKAGRQLMHKLVGRLHGPALPRYVLDLPGGAGKVHLCDYTVQPVQGADARGEDARLTGQLWQLQAPATRDARGAGTRHTYVDLSFCR